MVQSKHFQRRGLVELKFISLLVICCVMKTLVFTRMFCWKYSIMQHVSLWSLCVDDLLYVINGTFAYASINSIYEWFSSHFLECEYRSSIASIRLVYEVATSHRANLIVEYASKIVSPSSSIPSTRARCRTEAEKYSDSVRWACTVRMM